MTIQQLIETANALIANGKGLLAIDESNPTCNKRFAKLGIAETEERRRAYREMIITTPGLGNFISGAILYDETIRQKSTAGEPLIQVLINHGIIPGIKVDLGTKSLAAHPRETITEGLDGLRERLTEYSAMGARFAKWRAVFAIDDSLDTASVSILSLDRDDNKPRSITLWNSTPQNSFPKSLVENCQPTVSMKQRALERWENEGGEVM